MKKIPALKPAQLCKKTVAHRLNFITTNEIHNLTEYVGQQRALQAVQFGIGISAHGYNLFAMGPPGIGKRTVIRTILTTAAAHQPPASDWCYIYNFKDPQKPIALQIPAGHAVLLRHDMELLLEDLMTSIPIVFDSEEFRNRIQKIDDELNTQYEAMITAVQTEAQTKGLSIIPSANGYTVSPVDGKGKALSPEQFTKLSKHDRATKETLVSSFTEKLTNILQQLPRLQKERRKRERELKREFALIAVGHFIDDLKKKYSTFNTIQEYLDSVQQDVIMNIRDFLQREDSSKSLFSVGEPSRFSRYKINVLVDNTATTRAPVIYEHNPTYSNLICRVEYVAQLGAFTTDFTLIRAGALHCANGGYLVIEAHKLLQHPYAWEGLKLALNRKQITIESAERMSGLLSTLSLDPMPIPIDVKVILLGDRNIYYLLCELDPDFQELFKVVVDFEDEITRTPDNIQKYVQLLATLIRKKELRPFHRSAIAKIIDYNARQLEDTEKLSIHIRSISDLLCEADYCANRNGKSQVEANEVTEAIAAAIHRLDRIRDYFYEQVQRNIIYIETEQSRVGQLNALSLVQMADFSFGYPSRITARVRPGDGQIVDIQREVDLAGPIHAKGVLILAGFLAGRYVPHLNLSLYATLAFEQTYNIVEGDSASMGELCALLSAIADIPIQQSLAITGSVNQLGQMQAVSGINEKIEGFFDICNTRKLTGKQGVIIPAASINSLMLRDDLVAAAAKGKFHIYAVNNADEAMSLLTGLPAGDRGESGKFPRGSVNYYIEMRLEWFAKRSSRSLKRHRTKKDAH